MADRFCNIPYARGRIVLAAASLFAAGATHAATPGTPLGPAFAVLETTVPQQVQPAVARDGHGNFIVVWADTGTGTGAIFGRRFAANSAPLDGGFQISAAQASGGFPNLAPHVAMDAAGNFVVTWQNAPMAAYAGGPLPVGTARAWARRYSADGVPAGAAFLLEAATSTFTQGSPSVGMDAAGDFVVAWERASRTLLPAGTNLGLGYSDVEVHLGSRQVVAQRYDHNGVAQGARLTAGTRADVLLRVSDALSDFGPAGGVLLRSGIGDSVDVAMDASGDFIVAWGGNSYGGAYAIARITLPTLYLASGISTINARRYSAGGKSLDLLPETLDTSIAISTTKTAPSVAMDASGNYVVAWGEATGLARNATAAVYARRFSAKALRQGALITVGTTPVQPFLAPSVAADSVGDFVVAWTPTGLQVNASRYSAAGTPLGPALTVVTSAGSAFGSGALSSLQAASDPAGNFLIGWQINLGPLGNVPGESDAVVLRSYAGP